MSKGTPVFSPSEVLISLYTRLSTLPGATWTPWQPMEDSRSSRWSSLVLPWLPGEPAAYLAAASEVPGQILLVNSKAEKVSS